MASTPTSGADYVHALRDLLDSASLKERRLSHRVQLEYFRDTILPLVEKDFQPDDHGPYLANIEEIVPACRKAKKAGDTDKIRELVRQAATKTQTELRQSLKRTPGIEIGVQEDGDQYLILATLTKRQLERLRKIRWLEFVSR